MFNELQQKGAPVYNLSFTISHDKIVEIDAAAAARALRQLDLTGLND